MSWFLVLVLVSAQAVAKADDLAVKAAVIDDENVVKAVDIAPSLVATAVATQLNVVDWVLVVWANATKPTAKEETINAEIIIFFTIIIFAYIICRPLFVIKLYINESVFQYYIKTPICHFAGKRFIKI